MKSGSVIDNVEIKMEDATLKGYIFQYFVTISSTLLIAACSVTFGWASPTLPKLLADDSPVPITKNESSSLVSLLLLGAIIAAIPGAWMMDRFGRKLTLLLATIPLFIGWILIGFAKSVEVLYASRLISGFSYGIVLGVLPMYLGEIASNNVRGSISTMITISAKYGILYAYAIAPYVSMQLMSWLAMIPIVLFICSFIWLPETPYYLLGKGYEENARKSLIRLRGHDHIDAELHCMKENVRKANENRGTLKEFICNGNRKELFIILGLSAAQQFSGSFALLSYAHKIFDAIGTDLGPNEASIILGVVQLITSGVTSTIVDRWGRRPILLLSSIVVFICNLIVGLYFLLERYIVVTDISWLAMIALFLFIIGYSFGLAPVPHAILGEIFPKNVKAIAGAVHTIFNGTLALVVTKIFQLVSDGIGNDYAFFGFAVFTLYFMGFIYFKIPETKGKSFNMILAEMNPPRINDRNSDSVNSMNTEISCISFNVVNEIDTADDKNR